MFAIESKFVKYVFKSAKRFHTVPTFYCKESISGYYKNSSVFITGGTGFLGNTIIEKLLRSCYELNSIYVLVRPKNGVQSKDRLNQITSSPLFKQLTQQNPEVLKKVKLIEGDIGNENIITNKIDEKEVVNNVNVVIHSAATVKFNDPLAYTLHQNTIGTQKMLNLAEKIINLKKFVYVSSIYSVLDHMDGKEVIYKPKYEPEELINFCKTFSKEDVQAIITNILKRHPNTYTYSKLQAEWIVNRFTKKLPLVVVRPSLVTASWKDPFPGWINNLYTANGLCYAIAIGQLRSFPLKKDIALDMIPVDIVSNAVIAAPWHSTYYMQNTKLPIYNCSSSTVNKLEYGDFIKYCLKSCKKYPTNQLSGYPWHPVNNQPIKRWFMLNFVEKLESFIKDVFLKLEGKKTRHLKMCKVFSDLAKTTNINEEDILFHADNLKKMMEDIKNCKDYDKFDMDFRKSNGFNWESYMDIEIQGIRAHVLKEDITKNNNLALKMYYWKYLGIMFGTFLSIFYFIIIY